MGAELPAPGMVGSNSGAGYVVYVYVASRRGGRAGVCGPALLTRMVLPALLNVEAKPRARAPTVALKVMNTAGGGQQEGSSSS